MAKKSKLNGFIFKKLDEISNGLQIPTGNIIKPTPISPQPSQPPPEPIISSPVRQIPRRKEKVKIIAPLQKLDIDSRAFTPMTNVVPTITPQALPEEIVNEQQPKFKGLSRRAKQRISHEDLNLEEFGALTTKQERITYLALRGWSLKVESRGNGFYHYATKYIKRKKKRLYLGSIMADK